LVRSIRPAMDVRAVTGIYRFLKARRFDIVHTHSSKAGFVGRVAARRAGAPVIIHTPNGHVFYGYFGPIASRLCLALERWCARFTDRIITLTERGRREHLDLGVGLPEQYSAIPSGLPLKNFFPDPGRGRRVRERLRIPPEAPVLGTVGRLTAVKDQRTLIAAAKILADRHPDLVVLLIGDGGLKGGLEAQTRDLGLEGRIRFLGWQSDVPELLNALDVFVLCSLNEGMGRALVEAMSSGLPVVATSVGGMPDLVEEGVSGYLVPAGQPDVLAAAVSRMLEDRGRLRSMGERSREKSAAYTVERMINQLGDLYRDLVREQAA
ncbi:MAG: glycosyltransferase family 4 protein, partial [Nitrospinota bacterium]|nr:glycosyltransferase family 4 protein [Nitrospinota bacterium]